MLELRDIFKDYTVAGRPVNVLKGISVNFGEKEFVSVLGPSGCGKTTLLNIIGGLDQYTKGDLLINGKSTKAFKDHDWDVYRNHRIGFVFQTYNLIPHQTILGNVELALTISGMGKKERIDRAKEALDRVGLKGEYNKRPNQLSGGQQQRVAIARAIVNDPEILLADEPTGALDTVTSVQIMDILKEISKDRLVIMVTHNPELAEKYSTRIIRMLDGVITEDSSPVAETTKTEGIKKNSKENAKMGLFTSFKLSAKNLVMKLKRTILVIVAGSIGIIGVSSVLAVSRGVKDYIGTFQDDMLSGNPIVVQKSGVDYTSLMNASSAFSQYKALEYGKWVNVNSMIEYLVSNEKALEELRYTNELNFDYVNYVKSMPKDYYNEILLNYGVEFTPSIYTDFKAYNGENDLIDEKYNRRISLHAITETYTALLEKSDYSQYSVYITSLVKSFSQGVGNNDYILEQYDLLAGEMPKNYNDLVVVLNQDEELSDLLLAQLGYYTEEEFYNLIYKADADYMNGEYKAELDKPHFTYAEILDKKFTWYPNDVIYQDESFTVGESFTHKYLYNYEEGENWENGIDLKVTAIVKPKKNLSYGSLESGFIYSEDFVREVIKRNLNSKIAENINEHGEIYSMKYMNKPVGIYYGLDYTFSTDGSKTFGEENKQIFVGQSSSGMMSTFMSYIGSSSGSSAGGFSAIATAKTMDINCVGGTYLPQSISIYPKSFDDKYLVTDYLDKWNYKGTQILGKAKSKDLSKQTLIGEIALEDADYGYIEFTISSVSEGVTLGALAIDGGNGIKSFEDNSLFDENGVVLSGETPISKDGTKIILILKKSEFNSAKNLKIYAGGEGYSGAVSVTAIGFKTLSDGEVTFYDYDESLSDFGSESVELRALDYRDRQTIKYSDQVELVVAMINNVINLITIALIVFTSLSLVVSTVMVAIITYVSVVERIKEIGVIRSLGGRKVDVSRLFNAETFVIGLSSGVFGIAVTELMCFIGNAVVKVLTSGSISHIARLTPSTVGIMISVSVILTLISGLIPASSAAKKNPVESLRTE